MNKLAELKIKFTAVVQAIEEIDRFAGEEMPEYNQLASEYKLAQKQVNIQEVMKKDLLAREHKALKMKEKMLELKELLQGVILAEVLVRI